LVLEYRSALARRAVLGCRLVPEHRSVPALPSEPVRRLVPEYRLVLVHQSVQA
jgi:hypothetical protein